MGKSYQFICHEYGLTLNLLDEVGKYSPSPSENLYCLKCEKVFIEINYDYCGEKLKQKLIIPNKKLDINFSK